MKIIYTLFFSLFFFSSSAQRTEVFLSSYFKTVQPKQVQYTITYGKYICGFGLGSIRHDNTAFWSAPKPDSCIPGLLMKGHKQPSLLSDPKQKDIVDKPGNEGVFAQQRITLRCYRVLPVDTLPRLIVDGKVRKLNEFSSINPNDIASVTILKSAEATALYGPDGANGLIVVNMKLSYKRFVVVDSIDKSPVARASVGVTMKNGDKTMFYIADDNGNFSSNSPKEFNGLVMTITAVGYETGTVIYNDDITKTDTIRLKRAVKICEPVIITADWHGRIIRCYSGAVKIVRTTITEKPLPGERALLKIYPNPVSKGGLFTTVIGDPGVVAVRILNINGQELLRQPVIGKPIVEFQTDSRWVAGIYFVQPLYENGRVGASAKMIIQ